MTTLADIYTHTRASKAWGYVGSAFTEFANDAPALVDAGGVRGLLLEAAVTNLIRNPRAAGAAAGNPGTMPTNWSTAAFNFPDREVVGSGTDANGHPYLDVRFSGACTAGNQLRLFAETTTSVVVSPGDVVTMHWRVALIAGNLNNVTQIKVYCDERTSGGTSITSQSGADIKGSLTSALQEFRFTTNGMGGTTARCQPALQMQATSGTSVDFTLRVSMPQLAIKPIASSIILPPVGSPATATRAATVCTFPVLRHRMPPLRIVTRFRFVNAGSPALDRRVFALDDGTENNRISLQRDAADGKLWLRVINGGVSQAALDLGACSVDAEHAVAMRLVSNDFAASLDGAACVTDSLGPMPLFTGGRLGADSAGGSNLYGLVRQFDLNEQLVANNAALQALAA